MAYLSPKDMAAAFTALEQSDVAVIAGGTDLFTRMDAGQHGLSLLDVTKLPGFRGISRTSEGWRIGAATLWSEVIAADLPPAFDGLRAAAREVGSRQIQNAGTIAGNLCNASPAADGVPTLLALEAEVELVSRTGSRRIALDRFILGVRQTALAPGELVAAIHIPEPTVGTVSGFLKLGARRYLVISIAMVAASLRVRSGRITGARVAVGACSPVARRLPELEARLEGLPVTAPLPLDAQCLSELAPISDTRGTSVYRREAVAELLARLLRDVVARGERADG